MNMPVIAKTQRVRGNLSFEGEIMEFVTSQNLRLLRLRLAMTICT
jgi:hypothetical protein